MLDILKESSEKLARIIAVNKISKVQWYIQMHRTVKCKRPWLWGTLHKYEHALPTTTGGEKGVVVESSVVSGVEQEQT